MIPFLRFSLVSVDLSREYKTNKRSIVSSSPHEYELPGLKISRQADLSGGTSAKVCDRAIRIRSILAERPQQSLPWGYQ
jgi:hypothetical protein